MATKLWKLNYVVKKGREREDWNVNIAGRSSDECTKYLENRIGKQNIIVNQITDLGRIDAITDELREILAAPVVNEMKKKSQTSKNPKTEKKDEQEPKPVKRGRGRPPKAKE